MRKLKLKDLPKLIEVILSAYHLPLHGLGLYRDLELVALDEEKPGHLSDFRATHR